MDEPSSSICVCRAWWGSRFVCVDESAGQGWLGMEDDEFMV